MKAADARKEVYKFETHGDSLGDITDNFCKSELEPSKNCVGLKFKAGLREELHRPR